MMFSRLQFPYFIHTISSFWAASGCRPHLSNHRGHGGTGKGGMRYLSVFQGLQALPPSIHAESAVKHTPQAVKHTPLTVKHTRPAVKHSRPAVKHSAPAVAHTGAPVEHSPPTAKHSTAAVEHTRQAIERSRATSRQRVLAFKQRDPALETDASVNPTPTESARDRGRVATFRGLQAFNC